ncbi:MAG: DUF4214 domain-containing protein [Comamonadaceae bacterium]|nr:MAG: DUF4214 domain-containing protein [Comamonadaceae bacterium]
MALKDPRECVHSAYFRVLARAAGAGGLNHFVTAMHSGMTHEQVVQELVASDQAKILREMPFYLRGHVSADRRLVNDGQHAVLPPPAAKPTVRQALSQRKAALIG